MRRLYVCSEAPDSRYKENFLVGILTEDDGKYCFEYTLGEKFPKNYLRIKEFPDVSRVYGDTEARKFVKRIIPKKDYKHLETALMIAALSEYDEWELLKFYGRRNSQDDAYLHETIPEGVIIHGSH